MAESVDKALVMSDRRVSHHVPGCTLRPKGPEIGYFKDSDNTVYYKYCVLMENQSCMAKRLGLMLMLNAIQDSFLMAPLRNLTGSLALMAHVYMEISKNISFMDQMENR